MLTQWSRKTTTLTTCIAILSLHSFVAGSQDRIQRWAQAWPPNGWCTSKSGVTLQVSHFDAVVPQKNGIHHEHSHSLDLFICGRITGSCTQWAQAWPPNGCCTSKSVATLEVSHVDVLGDVVWRSHRIIYIFFLDMREPIH
jgi:hypothetical protein